MTPPLQSLLINLIKVTPKASFGAFLLSLRPMTLIILDDLKFVSAFIAALNGKNKNASTLEPINNSQIAFSYSKNIVSAFKFLDIQTFKLSGI